MEGTYIEYDRGAILFIKSVYVPYASYICCTATETVGRSWYINRYVVCTDTFKFSFFVDKYLSELDPSQLDWKFYFLRSCVLFMPCPFQAVPWVSFLRSRHDFCCVTGDFERFGIYLAFIRENTPCYMLIIAKSLSLVTGQFEWKLVQSQSLTCRSIGVAITNLRTSRDGQELNKLGMRFVRTRFFSNLFQSCYTPLSSFCRKEVIIDIPNTVTNAIHVLQPS